MDYVTFSFRSWEPGKKIEQIKEFRQCGIVNGETTIGLADAKVTIEAAQLDWIKVKMTLTQFALFMVKVHTPGSITATEWGFTDVSLGVGEKPKVFDFR